MPRIRSDDGPRRLRAVWLGPKGASLPFEWTYTQWLACIVASTVSGLVFLVAVWALWAPIYGLAAAVMYGIPSGFWLGTRAMRGVTFDEPLTYRLRMTRAQVADRGPAPAPVTRIDLPFPPIGDLSEGARRAIGWPADPTATSKEPRHDTPRRAATRRRTRLRHRA